MHNRIRTHCSLCYDPTIDGLECHCCCHFMQGHHFTDNGYGPCTDCGFTMQEPLTDAQPEPLELEELAQEIGREEEATQYWRWAEARGYPPKLERLPVDEVTEHIADWDELERSNFYEMGDDAELEAFELGQQYHLYTW